MFVFASAGGAVYALSFTAWMVLSPRKCAKSVMLRSGPCHKPMAPDPELNKKKTVSCAAAFVSLFAVDAKLAVSGGADAMSSIRGCHTPSQITDKRNLTQIALC